MGQEREATVTDTMGSGGGNDADAGPSSSGDAQVDRILAVLDTLGDAPVDEHATIYLDVHDRLAGALDPEQQLRRAGAHGSP